MQNSDQNISMSASYLYTYLASKLAFSTSRAKCLQLDLFDISGL